MEVSRVKKKIGKQVWFDEVKLRSEKTINIIKSEQCNGERDLERKLRNHHINLLINNARQENHISDPRKDNFAFHNLFGADYLETKYKMDFIF